jgi:hypothetical protein
MEMFGFVWRGMFGLVWFGMETFGFAVEYFVGKYMSVLE